MTRQNVYWIILKLAFLPSTRERNSFFVDYGERGEGGDDKDAPKYRIAERSGARRDEGPPLSLPRQRI